MLTLYASAASPFVRKVRIAAAMVGLEKKMNVVNTDTVKPDDAFLRANPLGKIPALALENGQSLFDSRVIVAYFDHLSGAGSLIPTGEERFAALQQEALADGLADAAVLMVYEKRFRAAENYDEGWVARQKEKVASALAYAETALSTPAAKFHVGHIAQACALGFLDLRFEGTWRASHPKLVAWLADFESRVPSYARTKA